MGIQKITLEGKKYVVMPEEEYEDLVDGILAEEAIKRKKAGEETFPDTVVNALIGGQAPLRVFRKHRGLTTTELAALSGVGQSYISEIETGKKTGSVEALKALATALRIDIDDLV